MEMGQQEKFFSEKEKVLGQFFTPPQVAEFMVEFSTRFLDRRERAIDPACGDGVFLLSLIRHGFREVWGVDVDPGVVGRVPALVRERARIVIGDALARGGLTPSLRIPENYFDLAVGNPPFSAKYGRVRDSRLLSYELGRGRDSQAIEILFLERFIQLVREGGVVAIIIPDGILLNKNLEYVRRFILRYKLLAVVSLPRNIFRSSVGTTSKTSILFIKKEPSSGDEETLMISIKRLEDLGDGVFERGVVAKPNPENLSPEHYIGCEPVLKTDLPVKSLEDLLESMRTGGTEYGENRRFVERGLRYISAKVVTPLGIDFRRDPRYIEPNSAMDKKYAHVEPGDLLFVRVGVGCSGRSAVVVDSNDVGVADDWIYIIRLRDRDLLPYYVSIFMQSDLGRSQIERMKRGVGTVTIPQSELKKLKIPIPPNETLQRIKREYIEMVNRLREGDKSGAEKIFRGLIELVNSLATITCRSSSS